MLKTLRTNLFPLAIIGGLLLLIVKVMMPYHAEESPEEQQAIQKSIKHTTDMVNAMKICEAFLAAGTATKCLVDPYIINVWINTTKEEGMKICEGSADLAGQYASFGDGWRIIVFSPGSHKHLLATCALK